MQNISAVVLIHFTLQEYGLLSLSTSSSPTNCPDPIIATLNVSIYLFRLVASSELLFAYSIKFSVCAFLGSFHSGGFMCPFTLF